MIISKKNKVIYIAFPHTGSTFIHEKARESKKDFFIDDNMLKHGTVLDAKNILQDIDDFQVFMFVRHPVDQLKSAWGMMKRIADSGESYINKQSEPKWKKKCEEFFKTNPDIDKYILDLLLEYKKEGRTSIVDYYNNTKCNMTFLKYENFTESCNTLFSHMEIPIPDYNTKINSSEGIDLTIKNDTMKEILDYFRIDIERFGYNND